MSDLVRVRGDQIGKTGKAAEAWWVLRTCPTCGDERYVRSTAKYLDQSKSKQQCWDCAHQKKKQTEWKARNQ